MTELPKNKNFTGYKNCTLANEADPSYKLMDWGHSVKTTSSSA